MVRQTWEAFGRLDILVNNAGGSFGRTFNRGPLLGLTPKDFEACMGVEREGPTLTLVACAM